MSERRIGHLRDEDQAPTVESLLRAIAWRDAALVTVQRQRDAALAEVARLRGES
jgi:hypothetical protein